MAGMKDAWNSYYIDEFYKLTKNENILILSCSRKEDFKDISSLDILLDEPDLNNKRFGGVFCSNILFNNEYMAIVFLKKLRFYLKDEGII